ANVIIGGNLVNGEIFLALDSTLALQLFYRVSVGSFTKLGATSPSLSRQTWYCIEIYNGGTTAAAQEVRVDGSTVITGTQASATIRPYFGPLNVSLGCDTWLDDLAINDTTGSFNNAWCGPGGIVQIVPSGDVSAANWTAVGATYHYDCLNDLPGTIDTTTYIDSVSKVEFNEDRWSFADTPAAISASSHVNAAMIGVRGGGTATQTRIAKYQYRTANGWLFDGPSTNWNLSGWKTVYPAVMREIFEATGFMSTFSSGMAFEDPTHGLAQSFILAATTVVIGVRFYIYKIGSPTDGIYADIVASLDGSSLARATIAGAAITATSAVSPSLIEVIFATPVSLAAGTYYLQL
ncbi:MAG TPA: hypothetical protein VFK30_11260, partial [Anaerolineae bacterium]|nr:hypothetical protein [Anaerolineae bacterium]